MIKNIVFDMGNVILKYDPQYIIEQFTTDPEIQSLFLKYVFGSPEWLALDEGKMFKDEAIRKMKRHFPDKLHSLVDDVMKHWYDHMTENKEMTILARGLKERGYRIYLLSNASTDFYDYYQKVSAFKYFSGFYVSAKHQLMKPDPAIYESFFKAFRLEPETCFFIDDNQDNVNASIQSGMQAFYYTFNTDELIETMKELKIIQ